MSTKVQNVHVMYLLCMVWFYFQSLPFPAWRWGGPSVQWLSPDLVSLCDTQSVEHWRVTCMTLHLHNPPLLKSPAIFVLVWPLPCAWAYDRTPWTAFLTPIRCGPIHISRTVNIMRKGVLHIHVARTYMFAATSSSKALVLSTASLARVSNSSAVG